MELNRNYKFRLYPNKQEINFLENFFFGKNQAWNFALNYKIEELKRNSNLAKQDKKFTKFKDLYILVTNHLKERGISFNSGVIQDELRKLDDTFSKFHSKNCGFPKFKLSQSIEQSSIIRNQATSFDFETMKTKIFRNSIKMKFHRNFPDGFHFTGGILKRESDGNYYMIANIKFEQELKENQNQSECAIDLNVNNIAISDSNGKRRLIKLEDFSKSKYSKTYIKLQKQLSKRYKNKNFSQNTKKLQIRANKIYKKIKNRKEDRFHKISKDLTENYGRITIEKLEIKKMKESKSHRLNRLISDVSWNSLIQKMKYKAEQKNATLREINPTYSSQRCNQCGYISKNNRKSQSDFNCENCNYTTNADLNAADNLLDYDNWSLEQKTLISSWNQNLCIENVD